MNYVVIDDEINAVNYLINKLSSYEDMNMAASFTNACDGLSYLLKNPCDILFLDIEMPNINGIYIAEQIYSLYPDTKICFISAYDGYAIKAFELCAIDYILKPYSDERLRKCIEKICISNSAVPQYKELDSHISYSLDIICGFNDEDISLINYNEIYYFETINGNVFIHTEKKVYQGNKSLTFYEKKLEKHLFFKTHKCYVVNLSKADHFSPRINYTYDMYFKEIKDRVPVSRSKVKELKQFFT